VGREAPAKVVKTKESKPPSETTMGNTLGNKIQITPIISAQSKVRLLLRFFPNQNQPSEHRKLGFGLTISINEKGIRRVSRKIKAEDQ
jgi:hypothetical protein